MSAFYNVLKKIEETLQSDNDVNTVSYGSTDELATNKSTIYALSHFFINNVTYNGNVLRVDLSVICMDIVDISKEQDKSFVGNDNLHDVFNTQLAVVTRLLDMLRRGDLARDLYQLDGSPVIEPFKERFEDGVAGWVVTLGVNIQNDMTIC